MMRWSFVLVVAVVLCAFGTVRADLTTPVAAKAGDDYNPALCGFCMDIAQLVVDMSVKGSFAQNVTDDLLKFFCDSKFNTTQKTDRDLCVNITRLTINHALPWIVKEMDFFAWQIPRTVCADFLHLCEEKCCDTQTTPEQLHLSFNSSTDLSEMRVAWVTLNYTDTHTVQWFLAPMQHFPSTCPTGSLDNVSSWANGSNRTYTEGGWIGQIHSAVMSNLTRGCTYRYRVGDATGGWSTFYDFDVIPHHAGFSNDRPLRVLSIADMGWGPNSNDTIARMTERVERYEVDFLIHYGDISYADGDEQHWDIFFRKIEPIAARVPYMVAPGNHEIWWNFTAYKHRMWMPANPSVGQDDDEQSSMYYYLQIGPLTLLMLDSETWLDTPDIGPRQQAWAQNIMTQANLLRGSVPFLVVAHHRPLYCTSSPKIDCDIFAKFLRMQVETLYSTQAVDFIIAGHIHEYERTYPVYQGNVACLSYIDPLAPYYIVNGAAGNREGNTAPRLDKPWSVNGTADLGYMMLDFRATTTTAGNMTTVDDTITHTFHLATTDAPFDQFVTTKTARTPWTTIAPVVPTTTAAPDGRTTSITAAAIGICIAVGAVIGVTVGLSYYRSKAQKAGTADESRPINQP